MNNLFINLLFAHFIGDFFLQSKGMAVKKGASNLIAFTHVSIYTFAICLFTFPYVSHSDWGQQFLLWVLIIFIPHFIIDRWSLADKWLKLINGRSLEDFLDNGARNCPKELNIEQFHNYHTLRGGFTCIVYVVVDNVTHLMCLYYGAKLIFN